MRFCAQIPTAKDSWPNRNEITENIYCSHLCFSEGREGPADCPRMADWLTRPPSTPSSPGARPRPGPPWGLVARGLIGASFFLAPRSVPARASVPARERRTRKSRKIECEVRSGARRHAKACRRASEAAEGVCGKAGRENRAWVGGGVARCGWVCEAGWLVGWLADYLCCDIFVFFRPR